METRPVLTAAPARTIRSVTWRPLQRELHNPLLLDDVAEAGAPHVDERRRRHHRQRLRDVPHAQHRIDHRVRVDLQHDAGLHIGAKSLQGDLQLVRTDRHALHDPRPGLVGHRGAGGPGVGLRRRDRHPWQHGAALIGHLAVELRRPLRPGDATHDQQARHDDRKTLEEALHTGLLASLGAPGRRPSTWTSWRIGATSCDDVEPPHRTRSSDADLVYQVIDPAGGGHAPINWRIVTICPR